MATRSELLVHAQQAGLCCSVKLASYEEILSELSSLQRAQRKTLVKHCWQRQWGWKGWACAIFLKGASVALTLCFAAALAAEHKLTGQLDLGLTIAACMLLKP